MDKLELKVEDNRIERIIITIDLTRSDAIFGIVCLLLLVGCSVGVLVGSFL
jgi:hypothetical protein